MEDEFGGAHIKLSNDEEEKLIKENNSISLLNQLTGVFRSNENNQTTNENDQRESIIEKIKRIFQVEKSLKRFISCLTLGLGLIFLSFMFLPMVLFSPQKFVFIFSLGSFATIYSFIFYYGTDQFIDMIFSRERRGYTISFLLSLIVGMYFTFRPTYYIFILFCSMIQLIVMIIFLLSFMPGGKSGISAILNMVLGPLKNLLKKIKFNINK